MLLAFARMLFLALEGYYESGIKWKHYKELNMHFTTKPSDGQIAWKGEKLKHVLPRGHIFQEVLTHPKQIPRPFVMSSHEYSQIRSTIFLEAPMRHIHSFKYIFIKCPLCSKHSPSCLECISGQNPQEFLAESNR